MATGPVDGATFDYAPASQEILTQVAELQIAAGELGLPLATAALMFVKQHTLAASVLIGTAKSATLQRNLTALSTAVPREFGKAFEVWNT